MAQQSSPTKGAPQFTASADNQTSIAAAGVRRPVLQFQDYLLMEKLAHQNRERIPERAAWAKGEVVHAVVSEESALTMAF